MNNVKQKGQENKGFTLIELIVAIAVLGILSVPLLNSFSFSARVNHDSTVAQNANNVAQQIVELTKAVDTKDVLVEALGDIGAVTAQPGVESIPAGMDTLPVADYIGGTYKLNVTGQNSEAFEVTLTLTPRTEASWAWYAHKESDFIEVYNSTNVIFTELIAFDDGVLTAFENGEINYDNDVNARFSHDIDLNGADWAPANAEDRVFLTYGDLMHIALAGSGSTELKKPNIDKEVYVQLVREGDDVVAKFHTAYTFDFFLEGYTPEADGSLPDVPVLDVYTGSITYKPEVQTVTLSCKTVNAGKRVLPLYVMFDKDNAATGFKSIIYAFNNAIDTTYLNDDGSLDMYVVEQGSHSADSRYGFDISGLTTNVYTNDTSVFAGGVNLDVNKQISYTDVRTIYAMYDVVVEVKYRNEPIVTLNP